MFDLISSIYHGNKEFIHGVASTISIFSAVLWFLGRNERKKKKLYFQWIRKDRVLTDLPAGFSVSVSKGDLTGRSLVTDAITLVNNTDVIIKDEDFAKPIEIYKKNTNAIFLMTLLIATMAHMRPLLNGVMLLRYLMFIYPVAPLSLSIWRMIMCSQRN